MDLVFFLAKHSQNKKDGGNLIQHMDLFDVQEDKKNAASSKIFYYCKKIPAIILGNQCTMLKIVNGARFIIYDVIPDR